MGLGAILGGVQLAAGLFGGHKSYGGGADLATGKRYLGAAGGVADQFGTLGQKSLADYGLDNPTYRGAVKQYGDFLEADPNTDQFGAAQFARADAGGVAAFNKARAGLIALDAQRGVTGSGSETGALASSFNAQAGSRANLSSALAQQAVAKRQANLAARASLYGGVAGTDYARGAGALAQQGSMDRGIAGEYLGLGQGEQAQEEAAQQAQYDEIAGGASTLAGALYPQHDPRAPHAARADTPVTPGVGWVNPAAHPADTYNVGGDAVTGTSFGDFNAVPAPQPSFQTYNPRKVALRKNLGY